MKSRTGRRAKVAMLCILGLAFLDACKARSPQRSGVKDQADAAPSAELTDMSMGKRLFGSLTYLRDLKSRDRTAANNIFNFAQLDYLNAVTQFKAAAANKATEGSHTKEAYITTGAAVGTVYLSFWPLIGLGTLFQFVEEGALGVRVLGPVGSLLATSGVTSIETSVNSFLMSTGLLAADGVTFTPLGGAISATGSVLGPILVYGVILGEVAYVGYEIKYIRKYYNVAANLQKAMDEEVKFKSRLDTQASLMPKDIKFRVVCNYDQMIQASNQSFADAVPLNSYTYGFMMNFAAESGYTIGSHDPCPADD